MSSIASGTTTTTGLVYTSDTSGVLQLQTNGTTTAVTIDTAQRVGIGTSSPSYKLDVSTSPSSASYDGTNIKNGANSTVIGCYLTGSSYSFRGIGASQSWLYSNVGNFNMMSDGGAITFSTGTNSGVQAILDTSGNLLVGTTTALTSASTRPCYQVANSDGFAWVARNTNATAGKYWDVQVGTSNQVYFVNNGAIGVTMADNAQAWSAYSDTRLKTITGTYTTPLADIAKIETIKFTWNADEEKKQRVGVTAQSVQSVVPEAIDSFKLVNANEINDQTEYLSVRYTELIPLMIASIQELSAKVTALEAKVGA